MTLDEFFAGYAESRCIFDAMYAAIAALGPTEIRVTKSQIALRRGKAFAWVWVPDRYLHGKHAPLVLSLALPKRNKSPRWKEIVEPSPGRFMHHLELRSAADIDSEVLGWLKEAGGMSNMQTGNSMPRNIDEYIADFPPDVQAVLQKIRTTIKEAAPDAEEKISYRMPTFFLKGNLVHFSAFQKHIGFYPTPTGIEQFQDELSAYKWAKGSVQFPLDKPIPYELISKIVKFRVKENLKKAKRQS